MSEKTITVEIHVADARALNDHGHVGHDIVLATRKALAEHDAKENPMGLPWEALQARNGSWLVRNTHEFAIAEGLTEKTARLIAAAPELANFAEEVLRNINCLKNLRCEGVNRGRAALAKAGQR